MKSTTNKNQKAGAKRIIIGAKPRSAAGNAAGKSKIILQDKQVSNNGNNRKAAPKSEARGGGANAPNVANKPKANNGRPGPATSQKSVPQQQPKSNTAALNNVTSSNARPTSAKGGKSSGSLSDMTMALQTANSIAINRSHPRQSEVIQLLQTYDKGWVENKRFIELLRGMIF